MKIMIGLEELSSAEDVRELVDAGAGEFYCGFIPLEWSKFYNYEVSINRREWRQNQFTTISKFESIVKAVHKLGRKIHVAANAHYYTREQIPYLEEYFRLLSSLKVDGIIVADVALMEVLEPLDLGLNLIISGEAGVYSSRSAEFYKKLGASRIIFPRDITLKEMQIIIERTRHLGLEYEAFILAERCSFSAGYCRAEHGFFDRQNFCFSPWHKQIFIRMPCDFSQKLTEAGAHDIMDAIPRQDLRILKKARHNAGQYNFWGNTGILNVLPLNDYILSVCGLCAIPRLKKIGVNYLKVVSRGGSKDAKIHRLNYIGQVLKHTDCTPAYCKSLKNSPEICELGYMCYYPEAREENK